MQLSDLDVIILAGGQGSRIRHLLPEGTPKCMANIGGQPFLRRLQVHLEDEGFRRFIALIGHGAEHVYDFYHGGSKEEREAWEKQPSPTVSFHYCDTSKTRISFVKELRPLGTAGAILNCIEGISGDPFFVVNGDTYCELDFPDILRSHREIGFDATVPYDPKRLNGRHAGTYLFSKKAIEAVAYLGPKFDLADAFAVFPKRGVRVNWYPTDVPFYDIGSPLGLETFRAYATGRKW